MPEVKPQTNSARFLTLQQAAVGMPYPADYLRLRAGQGKLRAVKLGRSWFTTREWMRHYVVEHSVHKPLPSAPAPASRSTAEPLLKVVAQSALAKGDLPADSSVVEPVYQAGSSKSFWAIGELLNNLIDIIIGRIESLSGLMRLFDILNWQTVAVAAVLATMVVISRLPSATEHVNTVSGQLRSHLVGAPAKFDGLIQSATDYLWSSQLKLGSELSRASRPYNRFSLPKFYAVGKHISKVTAPLAVTSFNWQLELGKRISPSVDDLTSLVAATDKFDGLIQSATDYLWSSQLKLGSELSRASRPYNRFSLPKFYAVGRHISKVTAPLAVTSFNWQLELGKRISPSVDDLTSFVRTVAKSDGLIQSATDYLWSSQLKLGSEFSRASRPYNRFSLPKFYAVGKHISKVTAPLAVTTFNWQLELGKRISPSVDDLTSFVRTVAKSDGGATAYGVSRVRGLSSSSSDESLFSAARYRRWLEGLHDNVVALFNRGRNLAFNLYFSGGKQTDVSVNNGAGNVPTLVDGGQPEVSDEQAAVFPDSTGSGSVTPEQLADESKSSIIVAGGDGRGSVQPSPSGSTTPVALPATVSKFSVSGKLNAGAISAASISAKAGSFGSLTADSLTADEFTVNGPMSFADGFTAGIYPRQLTFAAPTGLLDVYSLQVRGGGAVIQGPLTLRGVLNLEGGLGLTRMSELQVNGPAILDTVDAASIETSRLTAGTIESTGHLLAKSLGVAGYGGINNLATQRLTVGKSLAVAGTTTFTGGVTLPGASVGGSLTPTVDNTYDLGASGNRWHNVFLGPEGVQVSSTSGTTGAGDDYTLGELKFSGANLVLQSSVQGAGTAGDIILTPASGHLGIGTTSPTNILSLGNSAAQKFWIENSATDVVGRALTVAAGSTVAGTSVSDVVGGNLILQSGLGTGTGDSSISFQTGTTLTTGTTLQTMSTKMTILGNGNVGIGTTAPGYALDVQTSGSGGNIRSLR